MTGVLLLLQGLGGRDIGLDHDLFDQPVRLEALAGETSVDDALLVEHDLALRQSRSSGARLSRAAVSAA